MASIFKVTRKKGSAYRAVIKKNGKVVTSKVFKLKSHASKWAARIEADQDLVNALGQKGAALTLGELIDQFIEQHTGKDPWLPNRIRWWQPRLGDIKLPDITPDLIEEHLIEYAAGKVQHYAGIGSDMKYKLKQLDKLRAAGTVNRMRAALSSVFRYAKTNRIWLNNPVELVPKKKENNTRVRYLSDDERDRLLIACRNSRWRRLHLLVRMAITTGARRSELLNLSWQDINFKSREAILKDTKNGEPRVLTLTDFIIEEMKSFRGIGLIFPSFHNKNKPANINEHWRTALKKAEITNFRFHDLRHTAASYLVMNGATLYETAQVLGHRSTATTERYAHLSNAHKQALTDRVMSEVFNK